MDMTAEYETTINALLAENDKLIKLVDWQNDEIERLREALRYYAKNHYPDIDAGPWGPNSNDWGDVARAALGGEE